MNFIVLGMGYISPKHLDAIKAVGGNLVAYHDISDVVGHVDSRFINAKFYREFIHLDCFVNRFQRGPDKIDYAVILLPNHLHNPACQWAMLHGMDVICEKPLVIHERNIDELAEIEQKTGKKVNVVLQCRLHGEALKAKEKYIKGVYALKVDYRTPRGPWYMTNSWKGDVEGREGFCVI
jgi:UDP-N-acetyl-2-amino-2-deoxyglucuronate dehydrogenase